MNTVTTGLPTNPNVETQMTIEIQMLKCERCFLCLDFGIDLTFELCHLILLGMWCSVSPVGAGLVPAHIMPAWALLTHVFIISCFDCFMRRCCLALSSACRTNSVPGIQGFLRGLNTKFCGIPRWSARSDTVGAGLVPASRPLQRFPADRFDQYLTNVSTGGILIIEV